MSVGIELAEDEILRLREKHYNADVIGIWRIHDDLMILRVRPDWGMTEFSPGQYSVLGLGYWEPRVAGVLDDTVDDLHARRVVKRAYSFSCPMLDARKTILPPSRCDFFEFYIVLIRQGENAPPGLTPRLFALKVGDRVFVGPKVTGHYTLDGVRPTDDVAFFGTGTGEAPHNAMVAQLLADGHGGKIVCVTCVRNRQDLGYVAAHRELEKQAADYRYLTLTTRERENLDPNHPGYVGKRYLQDYFQSDDFLCDSGIEMQPDRCHIFLCGNPAMIGAPRSGVDPAARYPSPTGMVELLERRGFKADEKGEPGNIHFEKYW